MQVLGEVGTYSVANLKQAHRGCAKSPNFYMSDDFDEPLVVFKDYM